MGQTFIYGLNALYGADAERIAAASQPHPATPQPLLYGYGDGYAAERCVAALEG